MTTKDLRIQEQQILALLNKYGITNAAIFGSFARGDAQSDSDVDLLVTYQPGTTLFDIARLQEELEQELGRQVDLVSRRGLSKRLASRIEQDLRPLSLV
jgi:predicted nucleotidyltransferase